MQQSSHNIISNLERMKMRPPPMDNFKPLNERKGFSSVNVSPPPELLSPTFKQMKSNSPSVLKAITSDREAMLME
jgi:hypothetical protein